jgi:hypothetical protein
MHAGQLVDARMEEHREALNVEVRNNESNTFVD